jgi:hypothetical protein
MFTPLAFKEIEIRNNWNKRVVFFDPTDFYSRVKLDNYKRFPPVSITQIFPKTKGICGCGCNEKLTHRRTRWATDECCNYAQAVWGIISGRPETIAFYLRRYYGDKCFRCDCTTDLKVDHIIPVKHGGGGGWLSNYQFLCHSCHVQKTNEDFGWKRNEREQLKLSL